jgi:hypothetical protein
VTVRYISADGDPIYHEYDTAQFENGSVPDVDDHLVVNIQAELIPRVVAEASLRTAPTEIDCDDITVHRGPIEL